MMIERACLPRIQQLLSLFPAVGIVGPRQVGKTTLARLQIQALDAKPDVYLDLENPRDRAQLSDPYDFLERRTNQRIILDEVQLMPELFSLLRPLIDADRRPGRFILLGSASPQLMRGANESLAGRVGYEELTPLTLSEVVMNVPLQNAHWLKGGYPQSLLVSDDLSELWRINYLESYLTRDLPQLSSIGGPAILRTLLYMLAGQNGELVNYSALGRAAGVTQATVKSYIDLFAQSFLVRLLPPYFVNVKKRLVKAPKAYVRDSGLLHTILGIDEENQLTSSVAIGGSWEGYVIEQLITSLPARVRSFFYRTHAGAEIDLVLEGRRGQLACIEVKRSQAPTLTKGFHSARADLGPSLSLVVAPVANAFSLGDGIEVVSLLEAIERLREW